MASRGKTRIGQYWMHTVETDMFFGPRKILWVVADKSSKGTRILERVAVLEGNTSWASFAISKQTITCNELGQDSKWAHIPNPKTVMILYGKQLYGKLDEV